MKALIKGNQIIQISEKEFDVHPDYQWVNCPPECKTDWIYDNGYLEPPPIPHKSNHEIQQELLPSDRQMINALWSFLMTGNKSDMNSLDEKIKDVYKNFPT